MAPDPAPLPLDARLDALLGDARWLHALARRLVADPEAAEDLVQDAWLVALEHPPRLPGTARAWFERVLANLGGMRWRAERARAARERAHARGERQESAGEVVERAEGQRWLVAQVLALDEPQRSTVLWRFFDGLSSAAIARRAGVPDSTVRSRLARGLAELRARLERERGEAWAAWLLPLASPPPARALGPGSTAWMGVVTMKSVLTACAVLVLVVLAWQLAPHDEPPPALADSGATAAPAGLPGAPGGAQGREPNPARAAVDVGSVPQRGLGPDELAGRVRTSAGEPLAGARVRVVLPLARQWPRLGDELDRLEREVAAATSDERGEFRIVVPAQRVLDLAVSAEGFADVKRPNLYGGERREIVLARGASLAGGITREGEPLAGVLVKLWPGVLGVTGRPTYETRTDAAGRYRLEGLPPGFFSAIAEGHVAFQLTLDEGEEARRDVTLPAAANLTGHVTDGRDEAPLAGARVWIVDEDEAVVTDADGAYRIEAVRLGEPWNTLHAAAPGFGRFEQRLGELEASGGVRDLYLLPGRSARGRIVDEGGAPVAGAYVTAAAALRADGVARSDARSVRSDTEGRFALSDLRVDLRHTLLVRAEGHACAVFDFPASEWDVTELELGDLPLEPPSLVSGRVLDLEGRALAELWVQASIEPAQRDRLGPLDGGQGYLEGLGNATLQARTDASGRFALADLPAGRWSLWAGAKGWARGGELELELQPGEQRKDVVLAFDPGMSISGVVVDADGRALPNLVVNVAKEGEIQRLTYDLTREDGSFSVNGLDPGSCRLYTGGETLGTGPFAARDWGTFAAGTSALHLVAPRAAKIRVRVLDRVGAPLAGAFVGIVGADDGVPSLTAADELGRVEVLAPEGEPVDVRAIANRYFDPLADFLSAFFTDENGVLVPDTAATVRGVIAGPEEVVVTIPGLP